MRGEVGKETPQKEIEFYEVTFRLSRKILDFNDNKYNLMKRENKEEVGEGWGRSWLV